MKRVLCLTALLLSLFFHGTKDAHAVKFEAGEWNFGINGFLDGVYTYMDPMPMIMDMDVTSMNMMGGMMMEQTETRAMAMEMDAMSSFDQEHLNLLIGAQKEKFRININIHSKDNYTSEDGGRGHFEFEEVYGEYSYTDLLKFRVGSMLAPFGIYNEVRYITPLFATVVLPQMYEMPMNYDIGTDKINSNFMPSSPSVMMFGNHLGDTTDIEYFLYISNGQRGSNGRDENSNKGIGARLRITFQENYKIGGSYYTIKNDLFRGSTNFDADDTIIGQENLSGIDAELIFLDEAFKLEGEYVTDDFAERKDRFSYYVRATYYVKKFSPFVAYDYAEDEANNLYNRGQARTSLGTGYNFSELITIKAEYHKHKFNDGDADDVELKDGTDEFNMFRASVIFVF